MKAETELVACAVASCKQSIKLAKQIAVDMEKIGTGEKTPKQLMPAIRANLAELSQRVHEFNAFDNVITT